jgi:hypothetical protein
VFGLCRVAAISDQHEAARTRLVRVRTRRGR